VKHTLSCRASSAARRLAVAASTAARGTSPVHAVTRRLSALLGIGPASPHLPPASADLDDAAILREERRAQMMVREYSAWPIDGVSTRL
jgi:hypothetical protein